MAETEAGGRQGAEALRTAAEKIDVLVAAEENQQRVIHAILTQRMETDAALVALLNRFDRALSNGELGAAQGISGHLQAIETGIQRLVNDQMQTRSRALEEARAEIAPAGPHDRDRARQQKTAAEPWRCRDADTGPN